MLGNESGDASLSLLAEVAETESQDRKPFSLPVTETGAASKRGKAPQQWRPYSLVSMADSAGDDPRGRPTEVAGGRVSRERKKERAHGNREGKEPSMQRYDLLSMLLKSRPDTAGVTAASGAALDGAVGREPLPSPVAAVVAEAVVPGSLKRLSSAARTAAARGPMQLPMRIYTRVRGKLRWEAVLEYADHPLGLQYKPKQQLGRAPAAPKVQKAHEQEAAEDEATDSDEERSPPDQDDEAEAEPEPARSGDRKKGRVPEPPATKKRARAGPVARERRLRCAYIVRIDRVFDERLGRYLKREELPAEKRHLIGWTVSNPTTANGRIKGESGGQKHTESGWQAWHTVDGGIKITELKKQHAKSTGAVKYVGAGFRNRTRRTPDMTRAYCRLHGLPEQTPDDQLPPLTADEERNYWWALLDECGMLKPLPSYVAPPPRDPGDAERKGQLEPATLASVGSDDDERDERPAKVRRVGSTQGGRPPTNVAGPPQSVP